MKDLSGDIKKLVEAEIKDRDALAAEAKEKAQEYFKSSDKKKWELLSPTSRSKINEEGFLNALKEWKGVIRNIAVISVAIHSGVSAQVAFVMFLKDGRRHRSTLSVIKEDGIRSINEASSFTIIGLTVPPYLSTED